MSRAFIGYDNPCKCGLLFYKLLTLQTQGELCSLSSLWMKSDGVTINMKATELYFPFLLFIMLYKMVLAF